MNAIKKKELFKKFLEDNRILVVDKSSASRRRLTKTLIDLGASRQNVDSVSHFQEASDIIENNKPQLILSDYQINGGSGFDLFKSYREKYSSDKKSILILVTSNISQSAVAKAAEEDVDSFIIKPYTAQSLEDSLVNTVISKLYPSEYIELIERGKDLLYDKKFEEALEVFTEAMSKDPKPSLALFYHGQAKYFLDDHAGAHDNYKEGLEVNHIHFKCQIGLYDLFRGEEKWEEAYDVVKNIAKFFPANPDRLKEVIRLAIVTENYTDIESFYELFLKLDERPEDVINYICSGMFVCGKWYLREEKLKEMRAIFEKIGVSCAGETKFLKEMIIILVEEGFYDDAKKIFNRVPTNENKNDYQICNYIANSDSASAGELISKGQELFNNNIKHPFCVKILIDALYAEGLVKKAKQFQEDAEFLWPGYLENYKSETVA